jgi:triacylglycerol lipase
MDTIHLKYPVVLVHGAGFRDKTLGVSYWGRIPRYLRERGVAVFFGRTDAWGSVEKNAEILCDTVREVLQETGAEKVNIIAHSRGGLEARYAISTLGLDRVIASLTTISTPHRGAKIMNLALKFPSWLYETVSLFINIGCKIMGDRYPDFFRSSRQLSAILCETFNQANPDRPEVYYQSYASKLRFFFGDILYLALYLIIKITDGDNDGLCPVASAQWGEFRGIITTQGLFGISHSGIIDLYRIPYRGIRIPEFYCSIAAALAEKGY